MVYPMNMVRRGEEVGKPQSKERASVIRESSIKTRDSSRLFVPKKLKNSPDSSADDMRCRYDALMEDSRSIILEWDTEGNVLFLNKWGLEFFGFTEEEIIGRNVVGTIVSAVDDHGENLADKMQSVEKTPDEFYSSENENIKKNGERVWIAWTNRGIYDKNGQLVKTLSIGIDRTIQRKQELAIRQYNAELETSIAERTRELDEQLRFESLVSEFSTRLINTSLEEMQGELSDAQRRVCQYLNIDLSTLWQSSTQDIGSLRLASVYTGTEGQPIIEQINSREVVPWCHQQLLSGKIVSFSSLNELPDEAIHDREFWRSFNLKSSLIYPLVGRGGVLLGAISFDMVRMERQWTQEIRNQLELVIKVFANALARQGAEQVIKESEDRYRKIFDWAPLPINISQVGKVIYANPAYLNMFGYSDVNEINTIVGLNMFTPECRPQIMENIQRRSRGLTVPNNYEVEVFRKDGSRVPILMYLTTMMLSDGPFTLTILIDISERKQSEKELKDSEIRFRSTFDQAAVGIAHVGFDGHWILVNQKLCDILGYTHEELLQRSFQDISFPEDVPSSVVAINNMLSGKMVTYKTEKRYVRKDGCIIWVNLTVAPVYKPSGEPDYFVSVTEDITERKKIEKILRDNEEKFRTLFMVGPDAFYLATMYDGRIIEANPSFETVFGYRREEVIGKTSKELDLWADYNTRKQMVADLEERGQSNLEIRIRKKGGELRHCIISTRAFQLDDVKCIVGIVHDISDIKDAQNTLADAYSRLEKTFKDAINTMAKIVEMRDPYTAGHQQRVASLARAIAKEMKLKPEQIEQLDMASIIHDIGKIYIAAEILSKPGKLDKLEFEMIKTHAEKGYEIVRNIDLPPKVAKVILQHHERLDGSGYPNGLKGDEILMKAKILSVADVVEAMASHRPYRPALGIDKALEEISNNRDKLYDRNVVDACIRIIKEKGFKFPE